MNRLQQSRRQTFGYVYPQQVQNNVVKPTRYRNNYVVMEQAFDQSSQSLNDMNGEGIMDLVRGLMSKGKQAGQFIWDHKADIAKAGQMASDLYESDVGKAVQNILPSSDASARAGFAGERHAILQLPNGKYGVANYMGPGTQVIKRLKRGDPPRTLSDKTAMRHDIDYALAAGAKDKATQEKLIREADRRMVSNLDRIAKTKGDAKKNIFQGRRLIQGKMAAEDIGLMEKGSFGGPLGNITADDMAILKSNRDKLGQEGYGMLPAQQLKLKLLKAHKKSKKGKGLKVPGGGLKVPGGGLRLAGQRGLTPSHIKKVNQVCRCEAQKGQGIGSIFKSVIKTLGPVAKEVGPTLLKEIVLPLATKHIEKKLSGKGLHTGGDGLRLAGQRGKKGGRISMSKSYGTMKNYEMKGKGISLPGGMYMGSGDIMAFLVKGVLPNLAKSVGVDIKKIPMNKVVPLLGKAIQMSKSGDIKSIAKNASKVILPFLTHGKLKTLGMKMSGQGLKAISDKLADKLISGIWSAVKWYLKPQTQKGKGLNPSGGSWGQFFKGFKKGFTTVFKPGSKILGGVATAMGQPELGVPLEIISGMM